MAYAASTGSLVQLKKQRKAVSIPCKQPCYFIAWLLLFYCLSNVYASASQPAFVKLVPVATTITGLDQALAQVRSKSKLTVLFPTDVPPAQSKLFAINIKAPDYNRYWQIAVTTNAACQAHGCIVGSLSAQKEGKLEKNYIHTLVPKTAYALKQKVKLKDQVIAYFTPGHAEADWHPPAIEWQIDKVLYVLSWEIKENPKQVLAAMANSAIESMNQHD